MFLYVQIHSKNKNSLQHFLQFVKSINHLNHTFSSFPKRNTKKFLTVLKSPHVNKTAQEQFEFRLYGKTLKIKSLQSVRLLQALKQAEFSGLPGLNVRIETVFKENQKRKSVASFTSIANINTNFFNLIETSNFHSTRISKTRMYLQALNSHGRLLVEINSAA